jgi:hypothetical protein
MGSIWAIMCGFGYMSERLEASSCEFTWEFAEQYWEISGTA